jgi:iron(III)-enterobactin esterase
MLPNQGALFLPTPLTASSVMSSHLFFSLVVFTCVATSVSCASKEDPEDSLNSTTGGASTGGSLLGSGGSSEATGGASGGLSGSGGVAATGGISSVEDPGTEGDGIFELEGPYKAAPEFTPRPEVPHGQVFHFGLENSLIYPGAPARDVAVYVPAKYVMGTPAPVMVFQDGTDFFSFDSTIPALLDNMIADGKIPALIGVFAGNGGGDSVGSERGLEYDTVSGLYASFVDEELLPRVEQETAARLPGQAVTFTKDPEGRAALGGSSGGAASFSMAWWRPDLFRRVFTFSGTYVNQVPTDSPFPHGAWVYHDIDPYDAASPNGLVVAFCENESGVKTSSTVEPCDTPLSEAACLAAAGCRWNVSENKPLRVWLQAGSNDLGADGGPETYRNFYLANQRLARALEMRGYHVHYDDCLDAGHVDGAAWRQTLPAALTWLWRGYLGGI